MDLEYPEELLESHNSYPLVPEKKVIGLQLMSGYQKNMMEDLGLDFQKSEKLLLILEDKSNCIVHYKNLQFYLRQGLHLKKVHRVIKFVQELWIKPYIWMNTELSKEAKSEFGTNFYKLTND